MLRFGPVTVNILPQIYRVYLTDHEDATAIYINRPAGDGPGSAIEGEKIT